MRGPAAFVLSALVLSAPAAAQLAPPEQAITSAVEAGFEDDVALLEAMVNINSGTHNHEGVRAVADLLIPEFEALGFTTEFIDQSHVDRAGHLFARHEGNPGATRILMIGHIDTVFEPTSPFQTFIRDGDTAIGPGVNDNKGGIIVILSALRAMQAAGTLDSANIVVALTGDEEDAGYPIEQSREHLIRTGQWADVALGFEGLAVMEERDMGVVARRSSNNWTLNTTGQSGHSSRIFTDGAGYGAIYEMTRILDAFRRELPEENLTYNVGFMAGGTPAEMGEDNLSATTIGKTNIIPDSAVARGDLRTISQEQTERVAAAMQVIVDNNLTGTDAQISFNFRYPPMSPTDANRALLARLNVINADMGLEQMAEFPPALRGAADISFVAPYTDGLAGMGPNGSGAHAEGESVDLASFIRQAQRAAILMTRLAAEDYPRQEH
ncbi:peptidase M20 [Aurantiacibacter marinus]|uniref:Peptidase M20 n=2 Tax=Aurantiacibacter marinus TaxID=874156 RepID=A0A0H0XUV7_9SPHN|nr:peptidase M20 [Aurantiacibacter marinus]